MISVRKQWTRILSLGAIVACLFFSYTHAASGQSVNVLIDNLYAKVDAMGNDTPMLGTVISEYCQTVLDFGGFMKDAAAYNAQQSVFVHLLCRGNMFHPSLYFANEKEYFKRTSFAELGFVTSDIDGNNICDPIFMSSDCDLPKNMSNLLNTILNDYVNIKQSDIYGLGSDIKADPYIDPNVFSSGYFDGVQVCDKNTNRYPKSCAMVQSYIKNVRNILSNLTIFNATGVLKLASKDNISCSPITPSTDIFSCGLYADKGSSMISFVNLTYNEIFYYRLFMGYYMILVQKHFFLQPFNVSYETLLEKFSSQYFRSKSALSLSFKMMRDTYLAFPFHVGFSMYQEDLDGFGERIALIATPIYTLYDKLRNVQKPE